MSSIPRSGRRIPPENEFEQISIEKVGAVAYGTTNTSVADATWTKVDLDDVEFEDPDIVDADLPNNRMIVQKAGVYHVVAMINWQDSADWATGDYAQIAVYVNGSRAAEPRLRKVGTGYEGAYFPCILDLSEGDVVDMRAFQTSGVTIATYALQETQRLQVVRVG